MEVPGGYDNKLVVCICEMLGTAFLLIGVNWGGTTGNTPIAVGLIVMGMAQMVGPISGGHFNPAVTMGMFVKELGKPTNHVSWKQNLVFALIIILSQIAGGILGVLIVPLGLKLETRIDTQLPTPPTNYITQLCPAHGCDDHGQHLTKVFWVEIFMTFFFVSTVIAIVKHNGSKDMPVNAIAIGISLYTTIMIAGGLSGGAINPAVGLVQPIFQKVYNEKVFPNAPKTSLVYQPAYIFGPAIGGILAGVYSRIVVEAGVAAAEKARETYAPEFRK